VFNNQLHLESKLSTNSIIIPWITSCSWIRGPHKFVQVMEQRSRACELETEENS